MQNAGPVKKSSPATNDFTNGFPRSPSLSQNGNSSAFASGSFTDPSPSGAKDIGGESYGHTKGAGYLSPPYGADPASLAGAKDMNGPPPDSSLDIAAPSKNGTPVDASSNKRTTTELYENEQDDTSSKWIHRDKLARIESEELQAAGIFLPKPRARSKPPRRDSALDKPNGYRKPTDIETPAENRSRKNSFAVSEPKTPDVTVPSWDLRLPEEIAAEAGYFVLNSGGKGASRLPVAKLSPVPIPIEHIERDTPMPRKRDDSPGAEDVIAYPKTRSRSGSMKALEPTTSIGSTPQPKRAVTEVSPKKNPAGARKTSAPARAGGPQGRPKTRNGPSKDSTSSSGGQTRPTTRSGERDLSPGAMSKQPEGDPPWMISAYRPDPRLPPDQQLLPTVAKRLQQEKWEREGKFGNVYDKEFRPLNDEGFLKPPESPQKNTAEKENDRSLEWPLKTEARSPTPAQGRTGSYSTIPKIQDKPMVSPLPSPRSPLPQTDGSAVQRVPDVPEEQEQQKKSCGCCIVM